MSKPPRFTPTKRPNGKWSVNVPAALSETGVRSQRTFKTRELATEFGKSLRDSFKEHGQQARVLSPAASEDASKALELLSDLGISLIQAAKFYLHHHDARVKAPTFSQAFKKGILSRGDHSSRYLASLRNFERRFPSDFSSKNIVDLTPSDISEVLKTMTNGATAWKNGLRVISAILGDHVKEGTLKENPCSRVSVPKRRNEEEPKVYSVRQLRSLFASCKDYDNGKDRKCSECAVPFAFLAFAGIRPEELTRLRWENVNLSLNNIRLGGKIAKKGQTRNIRIQPVLKSWIETIPESKRIGKIVPGRWTQRATRVKKEAGINGLEYQDALRHSFGSYLLAMENDINLLKADMGHQHREVYFTHYHNALTKDQASPYWEIFPSF